MRVPSPEERQAPSSLLTESPEADDDADFAERLRKGYEQAIRAPEDPAVRVRRGQIITHAIGAEPPEVPCAIVPDLRATVQDRQIAQRLLAAYARAAQAESVRQSRPADDLWTRLRGVQSTFLDILARGDAVRLADHLRTMGRQDATIGIDQGDLEFHRIAAVPSYRTFAGLHIKDILVSLAEAVGAVPCENPEQGPWGESIYLSADHLADKVQQALGFDITPPPIEGGLLKIRAGEALLSSRDMHAIYTAWSLKRLLAAAAEARICEIGGGLGKVAYWMSRLGVKSYTILDLPHVNVVQGWYLLKSRPDANVVLYGEVAGEGPDRLAVLPYFSTEDLAEDSFDLVLNQDSFPEVNRGVVLAYLAWIKKAARFFLSINQESRPPLGAKGVQLNVPELIAQTGGYRRLSRDLYWLRKGYTTELYAVAGK